MNLYNKPKIEWDEYEVLHFMGQYIWIDENKKLDSTYYTALHGVVPRSDEAIIFAGPYKSREKCRAAIEKKCQDLIVQYTVGIELPMRRTLSMVIDKEHADQFNQCLDIIKSRGHITEREGDK